MKARNILAILLVVVASCFSVAASAQEKLNAVMKKCESMDNVDMNVVQQRNPSTKKIAQIIRSVEIKNDKALVDEFLKAFEADRNDAIQAIDSKKNGKMVPSYYQFKSGSKMVSYSISVKSDGASASVSMIQNGE